MATNNTQANSTPATNLSFEDQFPIPADLTKTYRLGEVEYQFDPHTRLPFPVKQFGKDGVWVGSSRGINTYDRMSAAGIIPARPGFNAATATSSTARAPKTIKVQLPDGTVVEGAPIREPKPKKTTTPDGTPLNVDLTTGEPIEAAATK